MDAADAELTRLRKALEMTPQEVVAEMDITMRYDDLPANERSIVRMTLCELRRRASGEGRVG
jgi:hypothetical protein